MIVNLRDDPSSAIKAVLWSQHGPWLTFRSCELLKSNLPPTKMDGEVVIHQSNISFLQVVG